MRTEEEILNGMDRFEFDLKCFTDFKFFCENMLGLTEMGGIHDFQLDWVNLAEKNRNTVIEAPSGSSKTEIMGVIYPIWDLYRHPNEKREIIVISESIAQSERNLLARMQNYILDNEILSKSFVPRDKRVSWTKTGFKTVNGSTVYNVAYKHTRSYRAHLIICDEADAYEDPQIYFDDVTSRPHPGGKIILISTPKGTTRLIGRLKERKPRAYVFHKTTVFVDKDGNPPNSEKIQEADDILNLKSQGYRTIWEENEKFSFETMAEDFEGSGRFAWIQNYQCEIVGFSEDAAFPLKSIIGSYDEELRMDFTINKNAMYFIGADFATSDGPKADYDAYVVVELLNNVYTVRHIYTQKGVHPEQKAEVLKRLYETFSQGLACRIVADESNAGSVLIKMIRARGCTVIPQKFNGAARWSLILTTSNIMQSGYIKIPRNPLQEDYIKLTNTLQDQLTGFIRSKTDKGNDTFLSKAWHDDIAISFCMAINEASKQMTTYVKPRCA